MKRTDPPRQGVDRLVDDVDRSLLLAAVPIANTGPLAHDDRERVREALSAYMQAHGVSQRAVGKGCKGVSASVISQVISGTYAAGTIDEHLRALNAWMEQDARRRAAAPTRPFVETTVATEFLGLAEYATQNAEIVMAIGPAGIGKSMCARALESRYVGSLYVRLGQSCRTHAQIRDELMLALRIPRRMRRKDKGAPHRSHDQRVFDAMEGSGRLLIVDEAHCLSDTGVEFLRELHDRCETPMIMFCTKDLYERLCHGELADEDHGQFSSRIGFVLDVVADLHRKRVGGKKRTRQLFSVDDVRKLYAHLAPRMRMSPDGERFMLVVANNLGGGSIRRCDKIVRAAERMARKELGLGRTARVTITAEHMADAQSLTRRDGDTLTAAQQLTNAQQEVA